MSASALHLLGQAPGYPTITEALGALQTVLEYLGTIAFAVSGALVAAKRNMDLVGVVVLGTIVAVGGGTTRDLLLGITPVFWVNDATFVLVGATTAALTVPLFKTRTLHALLRYRLVDLFDAAGMSLFVITGATIALSVGAGAVSAAIVGTIAGVGGGIIRDVLAGQIPEVLKSGQFYASAAFAGALLYVLLLELSVPAVAALWVPVGVIFSIRMLSLGFGWNLPIIGTAPDERR